MNGIGLRGRLAPSPTGAQHLGNARTYLLAWLAARQQQGQLVLRIEDLDSPRVKSWASEQAVADLRWLGLDWDEGPDVGGGFSPYVQSLRTETYDAALQTLMETDFVYPCDCSRTDVTEAASAPHLGHEPPRYAGTCANWRQGDPLPEEGTYCWRFRCPSSLVKFDDQMAGARSSDPAHELGDFPVSRKTGEAAYQLAVVVDDFHMSVNHVVRGDDLLPSAIRQILLQRALGYPTPTYSHVPLVVGTDGRRLAKRHGDTRLSQYRSRGVASERIVGLLAWSAGLIDNLHPVTPIELVGTLDWSVIPREPFVLAPELDRWLLT
ncbi:MAG: tRNA glutamyl-Q(34) synthetase GluQRS [Planctomycetales bacterium]|nr:tRNA glutamyl-Q(34) synthetase GluQRS [Planctomycetales bacterium]